MRTAFLAALLLQASSGLEAQPTAVGEEAVRKHVDELKSVLLQNQAADGSWQDSGYPVGMTALAVLALKHAGLAEDHPALQGGAGFLERTFEGKVYSESLVICALELMDAARYRERIEGAVQFLARAQNSQGGWSYGASRGTFDNSNSQFAVLGLAAAERSGITVPPAVKQRALEHWLRTKAGDGGWSYQRDSSSYLSMTCAGIASLHLLGRTYEKPGQRCGEYGYDDVLQKGLKAMLRQMGQGAGGRHSMKLSYTLYAIERVGMFLDLKEIDGVDWYRWGASRILGGETGKSLSDLALDLLFLARGEAQVAIAKWQWNGDWNNDHQDLKNWVALGSEELNLKLDWIPARLDAPASPAAKASMIFASGHNRFSAGEEEALFVKEFLARGGTLVAEACCGRPAFVESFRSFVKTRLFPDLPVEFVPIPAGHPACSGKYSLRPEEVSALLVKTGCQRRRIVILTRDISCALNGEPCSEEEFGRALKVAVNLLQWAIRGKTPRGKLAEVAPLGEEDLSARAGEDQIEAGAAGLSRRLRQPFGRLVHRGEWDADLAFFPTLKAALGDREASSPDLGPLFDGEVFVKPGSGDLFGCPVLFITGHGDPKLEKDEWLHLRNYLQVGGTIIASACCGSPEFDAGLRRLLSQVLPNDRLEEIPGDDALWKAFPGRRALRPQGSRAFLKAFGGKSGPFHGIRREGRWIVIYSPVDLCCDLEGDLDEETLAYKKATSIPLWAGFLSYLFTP